MASVDGAHEHTRLCERCKATTVQKGVAVTWRTRVGALILQGRSHVDWLTRSFSFCKQMWILM